ncbi:hypothetical protein WPS_33340 [Vulcanimicrobium alpinum]|uniref:EfeO-type cupredoxin-like domain-containing protein n=1 Tax=Vulcanimicrobium alpinum TaxID=3016050 RepID=A0AAN1XZ54_UNVUL|nr:cupredoxin family copper-binding protein [Vulcanimicrobium alpinum]BDE08058.1 hypothetical protein WPS_33340 [Vulcanimicrobium alpinum]
MRTLLMTLAAALALGGAALAQSPAPDPSAAAKPSPSPTTVVHIKNFAFAPETVTIAAGGSVKFVEDDDTPHTVTATDNSYDSGNLDKGQSFTHAYEKPGTYAYLCAYHPYMKGTIVVK